MQLIQRRVRYAVLLITSLTWRILTADKIETSSACYIPAPQGGFVVPDFSLKTPTHELLTLSQLNGKVVLVII